MDDNNPKEEDIQTEVIEVDLDSSINLDLNENKNRVSNISDNKMFRVTTNANGINTDNPLYSKQKKSRIATLIIFALSILTGILSVVIYMTSGKSVYLLYCLELNEDKYIPFRTTSNSLFVIISFMAFLFITSMVMIIKGKFHLIRNYLKDTHPYMSGSLIMIILSFLIADFTQNRTIITILFHFIISLIGLLLTAFIIYNVNRKRFKSKMCIINECFLSSILLSLHIYSLIFNLIGMVDGIGEQKYDKTKFNYIFNITANLIYFITAILFLTVYKDIVYPSCVVIIETGLISNQTYYFSEILTSIVIVALTFFTVVLTVFKYKYRVFRIINEDN